MLIFIRQVLTLCWKEFLVILKDPRNRVILVMPIVIQSLIFGYVASFDLNDVRYVLLDEDATFSSRELAARFEGSPVFKRVAVLDNTSQIAGMLDGGHAMVVVHIGTGFERNLKGGKTVPVQVAVNGRNGNIAGIAASYAGTIIDGFNRDLSGRAGGYGAVLTLEPRSWFNPNLESRWNFISGMIVILAMVQVMVLSSLSVSREKEQGTFDQLLVTPFSPMVIMCGKAIPTVCVGLMQSSLVLAIALFWFDIIFVGSYWLLLAGLLLFNLAITGIGLCVSALTATMQQSMLYAFSLIITMLLLSGFMTPVSSMPEVLQYATLVNPVRYGVEFAQRIYLEGAGFEELCPAYAGLGVIAMVCLVGASRLFKARL